MFKKTDPNPQLDIFTAPSMQLGSRASKKYSDPNAWHNQFYSLVTTKIDEEIFKPLFPEGKKSGRPIASFVFCTSGARTEKDSLCVRVYLIQFVVHRFYNLVLLHTQSFTISPQIYILILFKFRK